ncbi:MAG TPA: cupin domain-containing protein [Allosphingosinicella sp.]
MTAPGTDQAGGGAAPASRSYLRPAAEAAYTDEYDVKLRRLFPWPGRVETNRPITGFGAIWVVIEPGKVVETHDHDEEECFIVVDGRAELVLNDQPMNLTKGDVVYIPRLAPHSLRNLSDRSDFVMIDIYWDDRSEAAPGPGQEL